MWSSSSGACSNNSNRVSVSPSKSSSTSSSPSPLPTNPTLPPTKKSMEEVWKDISFSSLHHHPTTTTTTAAAAAATNPSFRGMMFQDFLACPFNKDHQQQPTRGASSEPSSAEDGSCLFGSPPTVLSLNSSGPDFQYLDSSDPIVNRPKPQLQSHDHDHDHDQHHHHHTANTPPFLASINSSFDALASSSSVFPSFCKKRVSEKDDNSRDRRHKRMMKNRESAARSRARKQAYTNELELEIKYLTEENARLKRQQDEFPLAAPSQLPKKHSLSRARTAPF